MPAPILQQLMETIQDRKQNPSGKSYTASLLAGGVEKISRKIKEEADEVIEAAGEPGEEGRQHLIYEAGDLLYHLLVMLAARDARLDEVEAELARRFGVSGIAEKASRKTGSESADE
ncbi:phosphoribosyl-ATP diphosphatase [Lignipirellula cremea]|uniref:Phosphoribosyl-ATP pyrophosphatase n=1 Tax=Lignipirellula cremea TaxID=2528010 RepID=A0A518DNX8_9BACT|nr:phosphoribosyl-ATP diphosphatase [Lignipirellula cremea]QDU93541.1 Phosphoribosyl-ATP pyrophosphatase [Lignipirellula cremea]